MKKATKNMTDAEYGKMIRDREKRYALRVKLLLLKAKAAGIIVTEAEIDAEIKRMK